jgi:hypothetical protein
MAMLAGGLGRLRRCGVHWHAPSRPTPASAPASDPRFDYIRSTIPRLRGDDGYIKWRARARVDMTDFTGLTSCIILVVLNLVLRGPSL